MWRSRPARFLLALATAGLCAAICAPAVARAAGARTYDDLRRAATADRDQIAGAVRHAPRAHRKRLFKDLEQKLLKRIDGLHRAWLGTRWGLGPPQTQRPGQGKVNCGLFVALVLKHAGFNLPIWKFNRQASRDGTRSLAPRRAIRYFHNAPMKRFLTTVRKMGPGLYVIGLDFHTGFLRQTDTDLRFIHASYITGRVMVEPAATAEPIVTARYRVVGKILQPNMLRAWLSKRRIKVLGSR
jgi:hypothetical protein